MPKPKVPPRNDPKRHIMGILMNWFNYAPMVLDKELCDKRLIPFGGRYFSTKIFWKAVCDVPEPKRSSLMLYCVDGKSQNSIARERDVTQAQIWWEINSACGEIEESLIKC